ncbi:MAG: HD domain-containing protein [Saprospiraceae bacterium]
MAASKIFNDPIYGFISVPTGILLQVIEHPHFQRLRRIKQLGLTHYVYPGAVHTRFNHALGAFHLMTEALYHLSQKGHNISKEEMEAAQLAILLHDIGHGPFSHVLEHSLVNIHHETITLWMMNDLNREFNGQLDLAIQMFKGQYHKKFLHQLISSQLDVDRLDYLKRDSFYTGVIEGNIGIDRLIMMMDVKDNELVLEEKAIYTIEKFLSSRRIMYLQVYLHKTALVAEKMLKLLLHKIAQKPELSQLSSDLALLLQLKETDIANNQKLFIETFSKLDDIDIWNLLKQCRMNKDPELASLAIGLLDRKLFKIRVSNSPKSILTNNIHIENILNEKEFKVEFSSYDPQEGEIMIVNKNSEIFPLSSMGDLQYLLQNTTRYYTISNL